MILRHRSEKVDLLKKVPLFSNLSKRQLNEIAKVADQAKIKAGDFLAQRGKLGSDFVFIAEGKAQVQKDDKVIRELSQGDFFGEISLIDGEPRTATVIAQTDMTILSVHRSFFRPLLDTVPGLQGKIMVSLCNYVRRAENATNM